MIMRRLSVKLGILYIFLMIINISFFTILIHTNQVDLIIKNKKYESLELATDITSEISSLVEDINRNPRDYPEKGIINNAIIEKCNIILGNISYSLFYIEGKVIYEPDPDVFSFKETYRREAHNAVTRREFSNKSYTAAFQSDKEIHIYIPIDIVNMDTIILLFSLDISNIHDKLAVIYRIIVIFIIFIALVHIVFGFILHRTIVSPINILSEKSTEIKNGNYHARVGLKRMDEFGILSDAFNHMAAAIQEKIEYLDKMNKRMKIELKMAGEVQKSIYPTLRNTGFFTIAIYHKPLIEVSGDYHDIFPIGDDKYGCIIVDVCGHGIPAALITMLIKEKCEDIASLYLDSKVFIQRIYTFFSNLMEKYERFFTAFYIIIDGKMHTITFSSAGQSTAFLIRGNKFMKLSTNGIIIGFSKDFNHLFESKRIKFKPGDRIILLTDGIYEALNPQRKQYGFDRVLKIVRNNPSLPCNTLLESIISDLSAHKGTMHQMDDETLVLIEINKQDKGIL